MKNKGILLVRKKDRGIISKQLLSSGSCSATITTFFQWLTIFGGVLRECLCELGSCFMRLLKVFCSFYLAVGTMVFGVCAPRW